MKTNLRYLVLLLGGATVLSPAWCAAAEQPAKEKTRELRVLAAPDSARHFYVGKEKPPVEKETVAFLGVETSPVSATTSAQLGLPRGTGLVVNHIVAKSPAVDVLKPHDILLKLDDQILIEVRQLSVLIRNHKEGDEVTLTYLRGGQKATTKVKLGKQEVPKISFFERAIVPRPDALEGREEWDRVLSLLERAQPAPDGGVGFVPPPARIRIEHGDGPGFRAMAIHTGNSNIVFTDDEGSLLLKMNDGKKVLIAKNKKGDILFSGPVTTPEERKAVPAGLRERLEKLEGMHNITFHTDGDFKGTEGPVVRPRGISLPLPPPAPKAGRPSQFH